MFPLLMLLGCVLLLLGWRDSRRPWLRLALSGVLFGLAVFGYFIFAFFAPALLWLLFRRGGESEPQRPWTATLPWFAGVVVGYLPWIVGILLIRNAVGGSSQLLDWVRDTADTLEVRQDQTGVLARVGNVFSEARSVFTGEWPWRMILAEPRTGVLETLKGWLLLLLPLVALLVAGGRPRRLAIAVPFALVLSFGAGALIFGSRLGGHHYSAVLPLLYVAFGCACAVLWPGRSLTASGASVARAGLVAVAIAVVGLTSLLAQRDFHDRLLATGGAGLYSDAIDRFAKEVDRSTPDATLYSPDWGFAMPLAFLSDASPVVMAPINIERLRADACAGKQQLIVFAGGGNEAKLRNVAQLARRPLSPATTWSQHDGKPVFQVASVAPSCEDTAPPATDAPGAVTGIAVTPAAVPDCSYIAPALTGTVRWNVSGQAENTAVYVLPPGGKEAQFVAGGAEGAAETGPWVSPGLRFILRDTATQRELASTQVASAPCPT
jgi:hypothetical protein